MHHGRGQQRTQQWLQDISFLAKKHPMSLEELKSKKDKVDVMALTINNQKNGWWGRSYCITNYMVPTSAAQSEPWFCEYLILGKPEPAVSCQDPYKASNTGSEASWTLPLWLGGAIWLAKIRTSHNLKQSFYQDHPLTTTNLTSRM